MVSRLEEHKNLEFVFKTFSLINEELVVIGTGKLIEKYKKLYPKIIFKGFGKVIYFINFLYYYFLFFEFFFFWDFTF